MKRVNIEVITRSDRGRPVPKQFVRSVIGVDQYETLAEATAAQGTENILRIVNYMMVLATRSWQRGRVLSTLAMREAKRNR